MNNWAIIRTGGKQYKVKEGETLSVEKLEKKDGESINFDEVLLINTAGTLKIGKPLIEKAKVKAKIVDTFRDKKIRVVKYKSKSRYTRTTGHRQTKTKILIEKIES